MRKKQSGVCGALKSTWKELFLILLVSAATGALAQDEEEEDAPQKKPAAQQPAQKQSDDFSSMTADRLIAEANHYLEIKKTQEALPYLLAYLERMSSKPEERIRETCQEVRYKIGSIFFQESDWVAAADMFRKYIELRPAMQWNEVMKLWSTALFESAKYDLCIQVTTNALAGPPADVKAALDVVIAEKKEAAESLAAKGYRIDEHGETVKISTNEVAVLVAVSPSGYSVDDLLILNMNLGRAYNETNRKEEGIAPFTYVIENTQNPTHKGFAIMQVMDGMIKKKEFEKLTKWIPELYQTDARYDIRVNMALLQAALALYEEKQFDNALPLFRMILPRKEMIDYYNGKARPIRISLGLETPEAVTNDFKTKKVETLFGRRQEVVKEEFWSDDKDATVQKPKELLDIEATIQTLETLPPYESDVMYRSALLYDEAGRPWESARFFDRVYQTDPESELGQYSFYDMIRLLINPLKEYQEAEERAMGCLNQRNSGLLPRQVAYLLTGYYQQNDRIREIKSLKKYLDGFVPADGDRRLGDILKYECELYYMQAVADMVLLDYAEAEKSFAFVLERFPGSAQEENATYWQAVTVMFQERYEEALGLFTAYTARWPLGSWAPSAVFQSGTCHFIQDRLDEAVACYTEVIEKYPKAQAFSDACSLRGDIYGSRAKLDEAILDYERAYSAPQVSLQQAKYAIFQMAKVYDKEKKYNDVIRVVQRYIDQYGERADLSTAIYWIGKTQLNQGKRELAVQTYLDAIVKYGSDIKQTGVDSMIDELVKLTRTSGLTAAQVSKLKGDLSAAASNAANQILQLRLRAALAQLDGATVEFGKQLIKELPDLESATPPVLAAICEASFRMGDYSRSEEILKIFLRNFDESEFMRSAYKLRGVALFSEKRYDEALKVVGDAQARYGTDYDAAWAQIMKGEIADKQGRYEEGRKTLEDVLKTPSWRGEAYAEAAFKLGALEEAAGDPRQAFAWYQRTYLQYKAYAKGYWAAEAYLASARCLTKLGRPEDVRNTYRAMLFDKYVNALPQAAEAVRALGAEESLEIRTQLAAGVVTNLTITLDAGGNKE